MKKTEKIKIKDSERVDDLQIKDYRIIQDKNGFCFGMDSVLIANAVKSKRNEIIVDLGTGTGIIPIIIAAKNEINKIYGIEIQKEVSDMAKRSIRMNSLEDKIEIINVDLKYLENYLEINDIKLKNKTDIVVSNPPYMSVEEGLQNLSERKRISRHEIKCSIEDICKISKKLLKQKGKLYLVHRPSRLVDIVENLRKYKLEPKEIRFIYPKINKPANLIIVKAIKGAKPELKMKEPLIIYGEDGEYTDEIKKIYGIEI